MALENLMGLASVAPMILKDLPMIMGVVQLVSFVFLSLFFGSIALKGYKGYAGYWMKLAGRLGAGLFCLIAGLSISAFIPMASANPFIVMMQKDLVNVMIGGVLSAVVLMFGIRLVMRNVFDTEGMKAHISSMQERLSKALETRKNEDKKTPVQKLSEPYMIAGIALIAGLAVFALLTFPGFPDLNKSMLSTMGLEQKDIDALLQSLGGDMPPGCESLMVLVQQNQDDLSNNRLPQTNDQTARNLVTAQGHTPVVMYQITYRGDSYVLATTSDNYMCHIREGVLCGCMDVSSFMTTPK